MGLFSNFALHLDTVGGLYWSGDYPYYVEQDLRKSLGGDLVSIFGNGTCGDINHNDPNRSTRNKTDFIGHSLAATIEAGLSTLHPLDKPVLRVERMTVRLPLPEISAADVKHSEQLLKAAKAGQKVEFFEHVTAYKTVMLDGLRNRPSYSHPEQYLKWGLSHSLAGVGDFIPVDVHAICLGKDVAIVCLPGEVFVDLGLAIKRRFALPHDADRRAFRCGRDDVRSDAGRVRGRRLRSHQLGRPTRLRRDARGICPPPVADGCVGRNETLNGMSR